jgi:hypothetical protein
VINVGIPHVARFVDEGVFAGAGVTAHNDAVVYLNFGMLER